ncbi:hypothetical protein FRC07_011341 [Ceratobasidium sp. 392]|nr:hypothetical protein FRC07_011341 [Ceratobasidium sp. 392]
MLLSQNSLDAQTLSTKASVDARLLNLLQHLQNLPASLSDHLTIYPFPNLTFEPHEIDHYGSVQGALNHRLELEFGSRSSGRLIEFRGRGSSLEAIVDTFYKFIDGANGENQLLWKWVHNLTQAAIRAKIDTPSAQPMVPKSRTPRRGKKATHMPWTRPSGLQIAEARRSSAVRWPYDPADLEDDAGFTSIRQGRARDELLN